MSYATLTLVIGLAFKKVIPTLNRAVAQRPLVAAKGGSQFTRFFGGINHTKRLSSFRPSASTGRLLHRR